ncbi:MAG TPA: SPOR domain-containing protein [Saprospiraceae bacterium]|nr:SPOR domain-containing protein [Saprospiraceae bacterium]
MRLSLPFLITLLGLLPAAQAQEIQLNESPAVAQLCRNWVNANHTTPRVEGWRAQILSTTDRQKADEARERFRLSYPDVPADWTHEKPYYKVRAGAFRTRLEAVAFIAQLIDFPGSYPAKDPNIHPRDFLE